MHRSYLAAIAFLGIAACAAPAPVPELPTPDAQIEPATTTSTVNTVNNATAEKEYEGDDVPEVNVVASCTDNPVICKRVKTTGSNIVQRVCRTQA